MFVTVCQNIITIISIVVQTELSGLKIFELSYGFMIYLKKMQKFQCFSDLTSGPNSRSSQSL